MTVPGHDVISGIRNFSSPGEKNRPRKISGYNFIGPFLGERRKAMKKRLLVATLLLCSVILTSYTASAQKAGTRENDLMLPQALATGSGGLQTAIFRSATAQIANGSITEWVNAFNKDVSLTGTDTQCIEMRYSGEVKMTGLFPLRMQFRALVDSVLAQGGAPFFDSIDKNVYTTAAMNWWVCGLSAGTHTVQIQFGPYYEIGTSYVRNRTLIIEYKQ